MVAQSEAVMATGVALVMGAGIAAMAAVKGGRLGGGGLDRGRGASTIPAERSGSGKGGYSTLLWAHALVSGSIGSYLEGIAASRAAHEHLSPTGGRAKRVARMGRSGGYEVGKGRAEKPRHGCEVAGRAQAGGANTTYVQGHCARARVGARQILPHLSTHTHGLKTIDVPYERSLALLAGTHSRSPTSTRRLCCVHSSRNWRHTLPEAATGMLWWRRSTHQGASALRVLRERAESAMDAGSLSALPA